MIAGNIHPTSRRLLTSRPALRLDSYSMTIEAVWPPGGLWTVSAGAFESLPRSVPRTTACDYHRARGGPSTVLRAGPRPRAGCLTRPEGPAGAHLPRRGRLYRLRSDKPRSVRDLSAARLRELHRPQPVRRLPQSEGLIGIRRPRRRAGRRGYPPDAAGEEPPGVDQRSRRRWGQGPTYPLLRPARPRRRRRGSARRRSRRPRNRPGRNF